MILKKKRCIEKLRYQQQPITNMRVQQGCQIQAQLNKTIALPYVSNNHLEKVIERKILSTIAIYTLRY